MKKYFWTTLVMVSVLALAISFVPTDQEKQYYYAFEEKIFLKVIDNKFVVRYKSAQNTIEEVKNLTFIDNDLSVSWKDNRTAIIELKKRKPLAVIKKTILEFENVQTVQALHTLESGAEMPITDEFLIGFPDSNKHKVNLLHAKFGVNILETNPVFQLIQVPRGRDALEIANLYQESGIVTFSHPNFHVQAVPTQTIPNDTYFNNQFYLRNIGQVFNPVENHSGTPGADINILGAWDISLGDNSVIVAVLDDGVTSDHPDLPNARQLRLNGSNFAGGNVNDPSPTGNRTHGNACAGIIAATRNNSEGIAGIAPNVKIMPIRMLSNTATVSDNAASIVFAANNGAHILSCSWIFQDYDHPNQYPVIVSAIQYAVTNGRGGKGSIVVFAAGNTAAHAWSNSGYVCFPANVTINGVITVGASDRYDQQADYSPTGNPSSPNNQMIDVVAPSHRAYPQSIPGETFEVWSIDAPGNVGINPWSDTVPNPPPFGEQLPGSGTNFLSYTGRFGATSAAAPQIAGIAALILSINPNLTQQQVFNIITQTADQVGGYTYVNGISNELGYGRANACRAVQGTYISKNTEINGPDFVCNPSIYTISNLPSGATVNWSVSGPYSIVGSSTGTSVTAQSAGNSNGVLSAAITTTCGVYTVTKFLSRLEFEIVPKQGAPCGKADVIADAGAGTYSWTVTGDLAINGGGQSLVTSSNTIQVSGLLGGDVKVSITGACSYTIDIEGYYNPYGAGQGVISSHNSFPMMPGDPLTAYIASFDGAPFVMSYYWYLNNNLVHSGSTATEYNSNLDGGAWALECGMNTLSVEALLDCGATVPVGELPFERICWRWYRVTQDPGQELLSISLEEEVTDRQAADKPLFEATLYNTEGQVVGKGISKDGKAISFETRQLPRGVYHIQIRHRDGRTERNRVVIGGPQMLKKNLIFHPAVLSGKIDKLATYQE